MTPKPKDYGSLTTHNGEEGAASAPCVLLTGTIQVPDGMYMTARKDPSARLADYKEAFRSWLTKPGVSPLVFVENSGYDLAEFQGIANAFPEKQVELLSFTCPSFDGSLGKGYGEMFCLQHCLNYSKLLQQSANFVKVTGRYDVANAEELVRYVAEHPAIDVFCTFYRNLTWADSRVFGGAVSFLRDYFCPMHNEINDSKHSEFEHVLARAVHKLMADKGRWSMWPMNAQIHGISATSNTTWTRGPVEKMLGTIKHKLLVRLLARTGAR